MCLEKGNRGGGMRLAFKYLDLAVHAIGDTNLNEIIKCNRSLST